MKRITAPVMLCAALAFWALPAGAAALKATVPFDFHLGNAVLPAGDYNIDINATNGLVLVRNGAAKVGAFSTSIAVSQPRKESTGVLIFHKLGDQYYLNAVWAPDAQAGRKLPTSRHEKEAYARAMGTSVASVSATTR